MTANSLYNPNMPTARFRSIFLPILMAVVVASIYAIASWPNQFIYDDHEVIENQYPIRHWNDVRRVFREPHYLNFPYYRPLTRMTFAIQRSFSSGGNPAAYHLVNSILAGAVMLAAYALLHRKQLGLNAPAALIGAAWFALHPAFSECVYPAASGRETLLPMLFILLATWAYLGRGLFWLAMAMFAAALLCKEQAAVLPGIFLLTDLLGLTERPKNASGWFVRYLSIVGIFIAYFAVRHQVVGKTPLQWAFIEHPLEPLKSLLYGIQTGVAPFMELHYEPPFDSWFDLRLSMIALIVAALLIVGAALCDKPVRLAAIFWLGWFILLQLPTAHIVQQEAGYSERYAALAILAIPGIAGAMIVYLSRRPRVGVAAVGIAVIWTIVLAGVSIVRADYYSSELSFCLQWQNTNPNAAGPYDGFGRIAQEKHQSRTAIDSYEKALAIQPNDATAHNNLANLLADAGDFADASQHYEWLLHNSSVGADPAAVMTNYAQLLGREAYDNHDAAMRDRAHELLEQAITMRPDYAQAHGILGEWNMAFGSRDAAIRQFKIALNLRPDWKEIAEMLDQLQKSAATQP